MNRLTELKEQIVKSSVIGKEVLPTIEKQIYADGKITEVEAQFVYEMNNELVRKMTDADAIKAWQDLFVKVMTAFVLEDEKSKGYIDDDEANWLAKKVQCDVATVNIEKALLENLKKTSKNFPSVLANIF